MSFRKRGISIVLALAGLLVAAFDLSFTVAAPAKAATYEVLHSFCGVTQGNFTCADGGDPAPIGQLYVDANSNVFGATSNGGVPLGSSGVAGCEQPAAGCGALFELSPPGAPGAPWTDKVIYSFCAESTCQDGTFPDGIVVGTVGLNQIVYGVTADGGSAFWQAGTIFRATLPTLGLNSIGSLTNLFSSNDLSNGLSIPPSLDAAGDLFVTTAGGGTGGAGSVIFADTSPVQLIYSSFCSHSSAQRSCMDGANPNGPLLAVSNDLLFGTTTYNGGGVYQLARVAGVWEKSQIFSVCGLRWGPCSNQSHIVGAPINPGLVADAAGNLYGTTWRGGRGATDDGCYLGECGGVVFKLSYNPKTNRWLRTNIHSFCKVSQNCPYGSNPTSGLAIDAQGNLYGTTEVGGLQTKGCSSFKQGIADGCGVVFKLSPPAQGSIEWTYTVLHKFCSAKPSTCADGANPTAPLTIGPDGALYGAAAGGANGHGLVFRLTL